MSEATTFGIRGPRHGLRLTKRDHPRPIDRYIDYFEGRAGSDLDGADDARTASHEVRWPITEWMLANG